MKWKKIIMYEKYQNMDCLGKVKAISTHHDRSALLHKQIKLE